MAPGLWCAANSPVVHGALAGLALVAVSLGLFPMDVLLRRPRTGPIADFARARRMLPWARWISWVLLPASTVAVGGHVVLFAILDGKGCDARFAPAVELLTLIWAGVTFLALVTVIMSAWLRRAILRSGGSEGRP